MTFDLNAIANDALLRERATKAELVAMTADRDKLRQVIVTFKHAYDADDFWNDAAGTLIAEAPEDDWRLTPAPYVHPHARP